MAADFAARVSIVGTAIGGHVVSWQGSPGSRAADVRHSIQMNVEYPYEAKRRLRAR